MNAEIFLISAKTSEGILGLQSRIKNISLDIFKSYLSEDIIKIFITGEKAVGKTSLIHQIVNNEFNDSISSTSKMTKTEFIQGNSKKIKFIYIMIFLVKKIS